MPPIFKALNFEPCSPVSYSFIHLFIPSTGFWSLLVRLGEITNFGGIISCKGPFSFDQADSMRFAVSASSLEAVTTAATAVIGFTLKVDWNWLAVAGSLSFQVWIRARTCVFCMGGVSGEVTHYLVVLFGTFSIRDDFHVPGSTVEIIAK